MFSTSHYATVRQVALSDLEPYLVANAAYITRGIKGFEGYASGEDTTNGFCVVCLERCIDDDFDFENECVRCSEGHVYCPICADALGIGNNPSGAWRCCDRVGGTPMSRLIPSLADTRKIKVVQHVEGASIALDQLRANKAFISARLNDDRCQYRDDSAFCIVCLRYRFTDTPSEYPCVYCRCADTYCTDCAKSCGIIVDARCCLASVNCPLCTAQE
jgi:hypothetical protein